MHCVRAPVTRRLLGRRTAIGLLVAVCGGMVTSLLGAPGFAPAVKGVSLGAQESQVLQVLGRPHRTVSGHDTETGQGKLLSLIYAGVTVELCKPDAPQPKKHPSGLHVWKITVTGSEWEVSPGIRVGMTRKDVVGVIGTPHSANPAGDGETLHYSPFPFDASFWVRLKGGVVVEIGMAEDWS